jgi:uncharacterized repeat protein (TIGR02543 family)
MNRYFSAIVFGFVACICTFVSLVFFHCNRDNPFDVNSDNYQPGKKPHVAFTDSALYGYIYDTLPIKLVWSDTARGGKKGTIKRLIFDWDGTKRFSDTVSGVSRDTMTVYRTFQALQQFARVKAVDNDDSVSLVDSVLLVIQPSNPVITSVLSPATVQQSVPFTITVAATDVGGTITSFLWSVDEPNFSRSTPTGTISLSFDALGDKNIRVKVRDNKNVESEVKLIPIRVVTTLDTLGPTITFLSPVHADTVTSRTTLVYLQVTDPSGINAVIVNNIAFHSISGAWRGTITLNEGDNILTASAIDGNGNQSTAAINIFYKTGGIDVTSPTILPLVPPNRIDTIATQILTIKLVVFDESGVATVTANGDPMEKDIQQDTYFKTVALVEGVNLFEIKATDLVGNAGTDSLFILWKSDLIDSAPPVITINQPLFMQHIADTQVQVRGLVTDASMILLLQVNGIDAELQYPNWNAFCRLHHGYTTITVSAVDASVKRNEAQKSLAVIQNNAPRFTSVPQDVFVFTGSPVTATAVVADDDTSLNFALLHSIVHSVTEPSLKMQAGQAIISYTPIAPGIDTFRLIARDPWNDADTALWRVFIGSPTDSAPVFTTDIQTLPDTVIVPNTYHATVAAKDPNNKPIIYSLMQPPSPAGMTIDAISGTISWATSEADIGKHHVMVQASNGTYSDTLQWDIIALFRNQPPVLNKPSDTTISEGQPLTITIGASDANNDQLIFAFGSRFPSTALLDSNRLSWTPTYSDSGRHTVDIIVKELSRIPSLADTVTFIITVINVNPQAPTLVSPSNGATGQPISLTLRWNKVPSATGYTVQVATDNAFNTLIVQDSTFADTSLSVLRLANYTAYYWRVRAKNPGGISEWSTARSFTTVALIPGVPSLIWPAHDASNITLYPPLQWTAVTGATAYTVQVSRQSNYSDFIFNQAVTSTTQQVSVLLPNTKYHWRVNAIVAGVAGAWAADSFTTIVAPPSAPALVSPASGATGVSTSPTLSWNVSVGAVTYDLQISTSVDFNTGTTIFPGLTTTSRTLSGLMNNTIYYWRVNATNAGGSSGWSTRNFTTILAAPMLASPANGATSVSVTPTLSWNTVSGASSYTLQYATSSNFSTGVTTRSSITATSLAITGLTNSTTYYWRVNATNTAGTSDWSVPRSFTTVAVIPPVPDLTAPASGATNVSTSPTLSWNPSSGATGYGLQVATNSAFSSPTSYSTANTTYALTGLTNNTVYYWRVNASNTGGTSNWSAARSFTTIVAAPAPPVLSSPANNETNVAIPATLVWSTSVGAATYDLQVDTAASFSSPALMNFPTLTVPSYSISGLLNNKPYYWHVRAANAGGTSAWSSFWKFTTKPAAPTYTVTYNGNNSTGGSAPTDPNAYQTGTTVTVRDKATLVRTGYTFTGWDTVALGIGSNYPAGGTFTMGTKNVLLYAQWSIKTYQLLTSVAPSIGGTAAPDSPVNVDSGAARAITATANTGYRFVNWTVASGTATVTNPNDSSTTVRLSSNATVRANFVKTFTLSATTTVGGTISRNPDQTLYDSNTTVTLTANAQSGYRFTGWTGDTATSANPMTVRFNKNKSVTANFIKTFTLTRNAVNGSISANPASSPYDSGTSVELTATPSTGFQFDYWSDDLTGSTNPKNITMNSDKKVTANFTLKTYSLTINQGTGGSTDPFGTITVSHGVSTNISATPDANYHFVRWTRSNANATFGDSTLASTTVSLTGAATITANFALNTYTVTVTAGANGNVTPSGAQTVDHGATLNVTATSNPGYHFVEWTVNGIGITMTDSDSTGAFTVTGPGSVTATFAVNEYAVIVAAGSNGGVTPSGTRSVNHGSALTVIANPDPGYHFVNWTVTGGITITNGGETGAFTVTGAGTITANYAINTYTVTFIAGENGTINGSNRVVETVEHGNATSAIAAQPLEGFHFVHWTRNGVAYSTDNPLSIDNVTGAVTVQAIFESNF